MVNNILLISFVGLLIASGVFFWLNQSKVLFKLFHFFLGSMLIIGFFAPSAVMKQYAILSLSYLFFYMSFKNKYALYFSFLSLLWLIVNLFYKE